MSSVIQVDGLVKTFGRVRALDDLDLRVDAGEVHGFLGPNGAGKSTTIRVLLGLLRADAGRMSVLGGDPWEDAVSLHRRLAYVPGDVHLWPNLSGGEAIDLLGALRGGLDPGRRAELVERFQLDTTKRCRTYSKGNRQKVALVSAFASDAELYILDEPTAGLDPLMDSVFRDYVSRAKAEGKSVLLSSHMLSEVEALCDRISIIRDGTVVESGSLDEMRYLNHVHLSVTTRGAINDLATVDGIHNLKLDGTSAELDVDIDRLEAVHRYLAQAGVLSLTSTPPRLEDLFMRHYDDGRGKDAA